MVLLQNVVVTGTNVNFSILPCIISYVFLDQVDPFENYFVVSLFSFLSLLDSFLQIAEFDNIYIQNIISVLYV